MRLSSMVRNAAVAALVAAATPVAPAVAAEPPTDYTQVEGLSRPVHDDVVRHRLHVPVPARSDANFADPNGTVELYVEVVRPAGAGPYPVIMEASPYHGTLHDRDGARILPEPTDEDGDPLGLTGYFAPRGYAVVMVDLRGTGRSEGCLDHLGPDDARDLKTIVEWAASRPWSNGRVGMTGHSYVGSTPSLAAAQDPEGLVTILPSAGLAAMYDHQFQAGVPYFLQWAGPMEAYEQLAIQRQLPPAPVDPLGLGKVGDNFGRDMEYFGCGLKESSVVAGEDQLSGRYASWHAQRDWREEARDADIPVFLWHGVNDNAARVTGMRWFTERDGHPGDKLWLGQWDHGVGCCPTRREIQATYAMHAWFDKHLMQRDVETGPPVELFLSDGTFAEARAGDRDQIATADRWPPASRSLSLLPSADGKLGTAEPAHGSLSFAGDPSGFVDPQATGGVEFVSEPAPEDTLIAGTPHLQLSASVTAPRVYLIANVYDQSPPTDADPDGDRRRITQFAINPELRKGSARQLPVVPGERYDMQPPGFAMAHNLRQGHRLVLRVTTSDPDKVPLFSLDPQITVFTGPEATALRLPVVEEPALFEDDLPFELDDDVPVGRAQPPIEGTATPVAPGAGVRVEPVTSATFEFEVREGFDNARTVIEAVPRAAADIDLFLQRREQGGWSDDIASATSSSLERERLESERLAPGRYRVELHAWLSPPANPVDLTITFFNGEGEPGK